MNVTCPECRSMFRVDPAKLPETPVRARCSVCGGIIAIAPETSLREEFGERPPRAGAGAPAIASVSPGDSFS
ncbi:MAG TPA: zinc-ribbon domain-containing protein, partial [Tepidiformaceae bacterium]|nr:zinc-ribbon domain-containing protein [Tepidiformaceae bacterium]